MRTYAPTLEVPLIVLLFMTAYSCRRDSLRPMRVALLIVAGAATISAAASPRISFNTITTTTLTTSDPIQQVTADFNKDGHLDVMVTGSEVRLFTGDGNGALRKS